MNFQLTLNLTVLAFLLIHECYFVLKLIVTVAIESKAVVKRIARDKLDQVLTGSGGKRIRKQRQRLTLLDL